MKMYLLMIYNQICMFQMIFFTQKKLSKTVNQYSRSLLEFCKASGLRILNGIVGIDVKLVNINVQTSKVVSVIDLVLTKYKLLNFLVPLKYMTPILCMAIVKKIFI